MDDKGYSLPFLGGIKDFYNGACCPYPSDSDEAKDWRKGRRYAAWYEQSNNRCEHGNNTDDYEDAS